MAQKSPFAEDLDKTLEQLDHFLPFSQMQLEKLAEDLIHRKTDVVLADISPLGIAAANQANLPSFLVENFTWDWIYSAYNKEERFLPVIEYLNHIYKKATFHIQTEPVCNLRSNDLLTAPVSRTPRMNWVGLIRASSGDVLLFFSFSIYVPPFNNLGLLFLFCFAAGHQ